MNHFWKRLCLLAAWGLLTSFLLTGCSVKSGNKWPDASEPTREQTIPVQTFTPEQTEPTPEFIPETTPEATPETTPEATPETTPEATPETTPETASETQPPEQAFSAVPLYFQTDYPEDLFAGGTIETHGCSITALAMVASYMTDHAYLPNQLAKWFGPRTATYIQRMEYACDQLQLAWTKSANWHKTRQAIWDGKVAIVMVNGHSQFTDEEHFLVITGFTKDKKYMVYDPDEKNYSHWELRQGFEQGFEEWQISSGYCGGWIFDKSAMPEEPFIYDVPDYSKGEPRYPDIVLSKSDKRLLAGMIWVESQGEPFEGQQAIAEVVLNRMAADNFPSTVPAILYADGQFPSMEKIDDAQPNQTQYEAIERAMYGPYILPENVVFFATKPLNSNVWGRIGGHTFCYQWDAVPE